MLANLVLPVDVAIEALAAHVLHPLLDLAAARPLVGIADQLAPFRDVPPVVPQREMLPATQLAQLPAGTGLRRLGVLGLGNLAARRAVGLAIMSSAMSRKGSGRGRSRDALLASRRSGSGRGSSRGTLARSRSGSGQGSGGDCGQGGADELLGSGVGVGGACLFEVLQRLLEVLHSLLRPLHAFSLQDRGLGGLMSRCWSAGAEGVVGLVVAVVVRCCVARIALNWLEPELCPPPFMPFPPMSPPRRPDSGRVHIACCCSSSMCQNSEQY